MSLNLLSIRSTLSGTRIRPTLALGLVAATFASALVTTGVALPEAAEAAMCRPEQCGEYEPPPPPAPKPPRPDGRTPLVVQMGDSYASGEGAPDLGTRSGETRSATARTKPASTRPGAC